MLSAAPHLIPWQNICFAGSKQSDEMQSKWRRPFLVTTHLCETTLHAACSAHVGLLSYIPTVSQFTLFTKHPWVKKRQWGSIFSQSFHCFMRYLQILIFAGLEQIKRNSWMWKQTPPLLWGQRYDIPLQSAAQSVIVDSRKETQHEVAALNNAEIPGQWQRHPRRPVSASLGDLGRLSCCFPVAQT